MDGLEFVLSRPWTRFYGQGVNPNISAPKISLSEYFDQACEKYGANIAAVFLDTPVTFAKLKDYVDRFASALKGLGIGRGSRVMLLLPNSLQFIVSYYGTLKTGATLVPINPLSTGTEIKELATASSAEAIICLDIFVDNVKECFENNKPETRHCNKHSGPPSGA
jgi:long-chain acyl-CoA synthetase